MGRSSLNESSRRCRVLARGARRTRNYRDRGWSACRLGPLAELGAGLKGGETHHIEAEPPKVSERARCDLALDTEWKLEMPGWLSCCFTLSEHSAVEHLFRTAGPISRSAHEELCVDCVSVPCHPPSSRAPRVKLAQPPSAAELSRI